jgi:hypothetical protein
MLNWSDVTALGLADASLVLKPHLDSQTACLRDPDSL